MPLYEYKCKQCLKTFEVRQKFADEPLTVHEECGGPAERLISVPAFQFKGSGWYVTDYGKGNSSNNGKSDSKSDSKGDSKTESKTESKSESGATASTPKTESPKSESKPSE